MKLRTHFQSLYRSPLKTILTLLLLAAAAFLFLYNLGEYNVSDREYREARDKYEGVLTVEEQSVPDNPSYFDYFLMTDDTNPGNSYEQKYEDNHQQSIGEDVIAKLSALPYISRVEKRYLTAGVSPAYIRLDTDQNVFPYFARCILIATVKYRYQSSVYNAPQVIEKYTPYIENMEYITLENVELLAGDSSWLHGQERQTLYVQTIKEENREDHWEAFSSDIPGVRLNMHSMDNVIYSGYADLLQPGRRILMVLRNNSVDQAVAPIDEFKGVYPEGYMHLLNVGDDSLIGWWPYFKDVTDLPENWLEQDEYADLRELIRVTNEDVHTFDVVYGDDMAAQRRVAENRMICEEGRFITPADAGQPVCVVNVDVLNAYGLKVGDSITLDLGNYLSEQYAPLGAVAVTRGRQNTEYTTQIFTIIGSWRDLNEGSHVFRDRFWCWSNNAIFVPSAFLPKCRNAEGHEFKPGEISFVVGDAEKIQSFVQECLPQVEAMGLTYVFSDGGWLQIGENLMQSRSIALVKVFIFAGAALFALILTVWLFIGRKKREFAIFRALGMPQGEASGRLYVPFLMLGCLATILGTVAARVFSLRQLASASIGGAATVHTPAAPLLYVLGALGFLAILALMSWAGIGLIQRKSILGLLSGDGTRKNKLTEEETAVQPAGPVEEAVHQKLGGSQSTRWTGRYLRRLLGRNMGRSLMSLILAVLLAFAFGLLTVLRGIYRDLYQNVEVKAVFTGGLGYERAVRIANSGYVRDPFFEYTALDGQVELDNADIILTNRLDHRVTEPVEWLDGWDEDRAMNTDEKVLVMYASHAARFGVKLGDLVRVDESDWLIKLTGSGQNPLEPGETELDRRDKHRPFFQVVGIIQSESDSKTAFIPTEARQKVLFLVPKLELDIAEYTLVDYHQAAEFTDYVKGQLDKSQNAVQFTMDTSYADRIYKIHRLIETLYPLTIAAALLLGGILPGLTVLHASKEISILRALGVKVRKCVSLYTLAQVLCACVGLILGLALVFVIQKPELSAVTTPFVIYLVAHLVACAVGSGVFAWLCARKRVLEQLQAKE